MKTDVAATPATPVQKNQPDPSGSLKDLLARDGRGGRGTFLNRPSGLIDPGGLPGQLPSGIERGGK